jgi:hypothetical protein
MTSVENCIRVISNVSPGTTPVIKNISEKEAPEELLRLIEKDQASL